MCVCTAVLFSFSFSDLFTLPSIVTSVRRQEIGGGATFCSQPEEKASQSGLDEDKKKTLIARVSFCHNK